MLDPLRRQDGPVGPEQRVAPVRSESARSVYPPYVGGRLPCIARVSGAL